MSNADTSFHACVSKRMHEEQRHEPQRAVKGAFSWWRHCACQERYPEVPRRYLSVGAGAGTETMGGAHLEWKAPAEMMHVED